MQKVIYTSLLLLLVIASPVLAANKDKDNQGQEKKVTNEKVSKLEVEVSENPVVNPSIEYRNHGDYVSSVAKTHPGGKVVSEAAKSSIGKKQANDITPSAIPSATINPSSEPSVVPSLSIEPSISGSPSGAAEEAVENKAILESIQSDVKSILKLLHDLVSSLKII